MRPGFHVVISSIFHFMVFYSRIFFLYSAYDFTYREKGGDMVSGETYPLVDDWSNVCKVLMEG